jgi:hypothetical protein
MDWFDEIDREKPEGEGSPALTLAEIEELAAKPGSRFAEIWAELAEARRDREAQQLAEGARVKAEEIADTGIVDLADPETQDALRQVERDRQARAARKVGDRRRAELVDRYGAVGEATFAKEQAAVAAGDSWFYGGSDPLLASPAYRAAERARIAEVRARSVAERLSSRSLFDDVAEARDGIDAEIARVLA